MTKTVMLLGYPLAHSISPVFQQAAFDYHHLDVHYVLQEVTPDRLVPTVNQLRQPSYLGANVTIPHKQSVIPMLDNLDELALQIGAVNTIVNKEGGLIGHNTDAVGFLRALQQEGNFDPKGKSVVILGAGGVARAVGFALTKAGAHSIAISELLMPERATELATSLKPLGDTQIATFAWEAARLKKQISRCDLLVNCTPMGMKHSPDEARSPIEAGTLPQGILVYDVVYNPPETPLLKEATRAGARGLGGLSMLVYQGAISFELWTGKAAPVELMLKAAREALP